MRRLTLLVLLLVAVAAWWLLPTRTGHATTPQQQLLVPAYQSGYSATDDLLKQLLAEVRGLRQDVQSLRGLGTPAGVADGGALLKTRCASCHTEGKAEDRGGGFVLVLKDGAIAPLSLYEQRKVSEQLRAKKMPMGGTPLSSGEIDLVEKFLRERPDQQGPGQGAGQKR